MPINPEPSKEGRNSALAVAMSVGWELASFTLLGAGIGYWLDKKFASSPWGVLVLTLSGITLGLYRLIRTFSRPQDGGPGRR